MAQHVRIRQNSSPIRQEESVTPRSRSELLHMIRGHRVQEARAILTRHPDFAAAGKIQPRRTVAKLVISLHDGGTCITASGNFNSLLLAHGCGAGLRA